MPSATGTSTAPPPARTGRPKSDVNAAKWGILVAEMLEASGLKPAQAGAPDGPMPVPPDTIRRWLKGTGGVTADMVRDICQAMGYPLARALIFVEWVPAETFGVAGLAAPPPQITVDPLARRLSVFLTDKAIPETARGFLRSTVEGAIEWWRGWYRKLPPAPVEPSKAERDAGLAVRESR